MLVLLVLLSLSALGMVGMRNVTRSMHQSGTFRARAEANMYADAVGHFMAYQLGNRAKEIWGSMEKFKSMQREDYQGGYNKGSKLMGRRNAEMEQGETMRFVYDDTKGRNDLESFINQSGSSQGSGLFTWKSGQQSFASSAQSTRFEIVIRNPVDMPAPSGYSNEYCFKKVTIAVEAQVGNPDENWDEPRTVGVGRTLFETMVGPLQCQSN